MIRSYQIGSNIDDIRSDHIGSDITDIESNRIRPNITDVGSDQTGSDTDAITYWIGQDKISMISNLIRSDRIRSDIGDIRSDRIRSNIYCQIRSDQMPVQASASFRPLQFLHRPLLSSSSRPSDAVMYRASSLWVQRVGLLARPLRTRSISEPEY